MAQIRQFNILHFQKVNKMLAEISSDEKLSLISSLEGILTDFVQHFLPLSLRKSPESFIAVGERNQAKAFITIEAAKGNRRKWFVKRLFLTENSFDEGKQLIDFVIARYGALGADTFCVLLDENDEISAGLFAKMCGFRQCSREVVWKMNDFEDGVDFADKFEKLKILDAKETTQLCNDAILPHFRYSLEKETTEYAQNILQFKNQNFVLKDEKNKIWAYIEVQKVNTNDKIIDITISEAYQDNYLSVLKSIVKYLKKQKNCGNIFILNKNYMTSGKNFEEILQNNGFERVQTKMMLVKDFYKTIDAKETIVNPAVIFNEITGKPAFLSPDSLQKSD